MARYIPPRRPIPRSVTRRPALGVHQNRVVTVMGEEADYTGSTLTSSVYALTANGSATTTLTATVYKDGALASGEPVTYTVQRIQLDAADSFVSADPSDIASDGVETSTITVQAKYLPEGAEDYIALPGIAASAVVLSAATTTGNTLVQPAAATDANGITTGTIKTTDPSATKVITAAIAGLTMTDTATVTTDSGPPPTPPSGTPFFEDTFAGLQVNNADGFVWGTGKNTAIVSFDGFDCMRFRYEDAGSSSGPNAERRFDMGREVTHLYIEYDVHIPSNFSHQNISVNNNKWMVLWRDVYSDVTDGTFQIGYEFRTNSSETPGSEIRGMARRWDYSFWSSSGPNYSPTGQFDTFINASGPVVIGDWNNIKMEYAVASDDASSDGIQRMWINDVLFFETTTGRFWNYPASVNTPTDCWLRNGYFFGTANSGYTEQTDFHIKHPKFHISDPGWF